MPLSGELGNAIRDTRQRLELPERYDLGILLVHGIGEQARGDTLTEVGDHFLEWLRRRVGDSTQTPGGKVELIDVVSRQTSEDRIPAAHAVVRITPPTGVGGSKLWVVSEAWWADVFRPATYGELAGWSAFVGPWVFATQVRGIVRRIEIGEGVPRALRLALIPITFLVCAVLIALAAAFSALVTAAALLLVVLALSRLPLIADLARSVQKVLANGAGDAYVLTRSPLRFGAMAAKVRSDTHVLRQECESVAIVAHSQGTAVGWYALKRELALPNTNRGRRDTTLAPVELFLTYGQAIRKLDLILAMARGSLTAGGRIAGLGSAFLPLAAGILILAGSPWPVVAVSIVLAVVAQLALLVFAKRIWQESQHEIEADWEAVKEVAPKLEWLDLWASSDPASVGPLEIAGSGIGSFKIRNLASILSDHSAYWTNFNEFLAIVATRLFSLGGPAEYSAPLVDPRLQVAAMRRHARVLLLLVMRVLLVGGVLAGLLHVTFASGLGGRVVQFLDNLALPVVDTFFHSPPDWVGILAGLLVVLALGAGIWAVLRAGWSALARADENAYFSGTQKPLWTLDWLVLGGVAVLASVAAAALLWIDEDPILATAYVFGGSFVTLLVLSVLSGGGTTYTQAEASEGPVAAASRITGGTASGLAAAIAVAIVIVVIPAMALVWAETIAVTLVVEATVLSSVLAVEGIRQYQLFRETFNKWNAQLG